MATIATKSLTLQVVRPYAQMPNSGMIEIYVSGTREGLIFTPDGGALTFPLEEMLQFAWRWAVANNITFAQATGKTITFTVTVV